MDDNKDLVDGVFIKAPRAGAPVFVKGSISVNAAKFKAYLDTYKNEAGYLNMDILLSKGGTLYLKRDSWEKPKEGLSLGRTPDIHYPTSEEEGIDPKDVAF